MKILFLITELNQGGAENALAEVALRLRESGCELRIVTLYADAGPVGVRLREAGFAVTGLAIKSWQSCFKAIKLRRLIQEFKPDLLHAWLFHANLLSRFFCPENIVLCNSLRVAEPRWHHICLDRLTGRKPALFFCVSKTVMDFAVNDLKHKREKCLTIENGVDFSAFKVAGESRRDFDKINGLCAARKTRQKGLDILLSALALLPASLDWHWTFLGADSEPEYAVKLKRQAEFLHISNRITWLGEVEREGLISCFAKANLFALPSRWEGQANVILEAAASGVPILAAPSHGFGSDAPIMVLKDNVPEVWARELEFFFKNKDKLNSLAKQGQDWAEAKDWDGVARRYLLAYEKLLVKKGQE